MEREVECAESMVALDPSIVESQALILGFKRGKGATRTKLTRQCGVGKHTVTIDLKLRQIVYPQDLNVERGTVLNFAHPENLVVLDCVVRLLDQGYEPAAITLEKAYRVGHGYRYLDILVSDGADPYLMIECKTPGTEFEREKARLLSSEKTQIFSYFVQDRGAHFLVLYTTASTGYEFVGIETSGLSGGNLQSILSNWNKATFDTGLFDDSPFALKERALVVADLQDLTADDSRAMFGRFNEILRRHAVSDKANAFNKLLNLFICKVQDEEKSDPAARLDFQWLNSEKPADVMQRLARLYEHGLHDYLHIQKIDAGGHRLDAILNKLEGADRDEARDLIRSNLQASNTDLAFIDVYDPRTASKNAAVVRDVVRLLQGYRFRYSKRQAFLGMFFEQLLSSGLKQESGQFFTPPPIAQFICEALPVETIVQRKIEAGEPEFLPYVIDYAAGSGHFITEIMERIEGVRSALGNTATKRTQRQNNQAWAHGMAWAREFVYGIELDHRLAKATKVSCFLNGDGDANIVNGNGLGSFDTDPDYRTTGPKLSSGETGERDLETFDIVVANPPYSVADFKSTIMDGATSFELFDKISDTSNAIEVLFVERTKQLLKAGGVAAIVLPTAILSNGKADVLARRMILAHFVCVPWSRSERAPLSRRTRRRQCCFSRSGPAPRTPIFRDS